MLDFLNNFTVFDFAAYSETLQIKLNSSKKIKAPIVVEQEIMKELNRISTFKDIKSTISGTTGNITVNRKGIWYSLKPEINFETNSNKNSILIKISTKNYFINPIIWLSTLIIFAIVGIAGTGIIIAFWLIIFLIIEAFISKYNFKKIFERIKVNIEHEVN